MAYFSSHLMAVITRSATSTGLKVGMNLWINRWFYIIYLYYTQMRAPVWYIPIPDSLVRYNTLVLLYSWSMRILLLLARNFLKKKLSSKVWVWQARYRCLFFDISYSAIREEQSISVCGVSLMVVENVIRYECAKYRWFLLEYIDGWAE